MKTMNATNPIFARTLAQVADEMLRRHGLKMSPQAVKQTERRALMKLWRALKDD